MKEFKTKLKYDFAEALLQMIPTLLESMVAPVDEEKLFIAALREVELRLKKKMVEYRPKYQITFTPTQALALRMFAGYVAVGSTSYAANKLHMIANEIHQHYS